MKKKLLIIDVLLIFFLVASLSANDLSSDSTDDRVVNYEKERLSYSFKTSFDKLYPLDVKKFTFYQGDKLLKYGEFESIVNDKVINKNSEMIRQIKLGGFTAAIVLGATSTSFLIPSIIFIALQTNYYNQRQNITSLGYNSWLEYFIAKYPEYFIPGLICISLTIVTALSILVDLTVTFALLHKYGSNEKLYKEAIERYNKKLREKYKILPEFGSNFNNELFLGIKLKI